ERATSAVGNRLRREFVLHEHVKERNLVRQAPVNKVALASDLVERAPLGLKVGVDSTNCRNHHVSGCRRSVATTDLAIEREGAIETLQHCHARRELCGKVPDAGLVQVSRIGGVRQAILDVEVNEIDAYSSSNGESQRQQQVPLREDIGLKRHHFEV